MKKTLLLTALLFSVTLFGQIRPIKPLINLNKSSGPNGLQVYQWEAYTAKGALIMGVNKSQADAQWTIEDFTKRNEKNSYKPIGYVIKKSHTNSIEYFEGFQKKFPKGYKVLMLRDIIALRMIKVSGMNEAANFIENVTGKNHSDAFQYVFDLSNNFKAYSINI